MVIGILQFELLIHGAESLKDKRRVLQSVKDRLHREHLVSVAEVALQERMGVGRLALALVGSDGKHVGQTLDRITAKLRALGDAELGDVSREVLHDPVGDEADRAEGDGDAEPPDAAALAEELMRYAAGDEPGDDADGEARP